jgi:hypothetical protein
LIFDGNNFVLWSDIMKTFLLDIGVDVWKSIENGYNPSKTPLTDHDGKKACSYNYKARHNIRNALSTTIHTKVRCYTTSKKVWDKLKKIYEGDEKVKQVKLHLHRAKFENLKMKECENIAAYLLIVDEVVNSIIGLGK